MAASCRRYLMLAPLAVAALCLTGFTSAKAPVPPAAASPSWCAPVRVYLPRPAFHPLTASDAQLLAAGYPARPPAGDRAALNLWTQAVGNAWYFTAPDPVCDSTRHSTLFSGTWAGHQVPKADYGGGGITAVQSEWKQPSVPANSKYTNWRKAPDASFWTGMSNGTAIIQAGCDSIATRPVQYKCWTEDFPEGTDWEGPAVHAGDTVLVAIQNCGAYRIPGCRAGEAKYYIENISTHHAVSFVNKIPFAAQADADYINERVNGLYLPDFGTVRVWENEFWQHGTLRSLSATNNRWIMTSNCRSTGLHLSAPTAVTGTPGGFSQHWVRSRPYSDTC
jgi:hypothetical protein